MTCGRDTANGFPRRSFEDACIRGRRALGWEEILRRESRLDAGGSLLLITDHYPFGSAVRDLARPFGLEMHDGMTFDPVHHERSSGDDSQLLFSRVNGLLAMHPMIEGRGADERVGRVLTFTGQSLRSRSGVALLSLGATAVRRPARPRVTRSGGNVVVDVEFGAPATAAGYAQAVALTHSRGRVVVFGEAAMASAQRDSGRRIGMNAPGAENRQFVLNTLHWLTRLCREPWCEPSVATYAAATSAGLADARCGTGFSPSPPV